MLDTLLTHKLKKSIRSFAKGQGIFTKIFVGIIFILFGLNLLFTALFLQSSLFKDNPSHAIEIVNSNIFYYFLYGIVLRMLFQKSVFVNIEKYLHLPLSKNSLVHFLLLQSLTTLFNFLPLFFTIPFALIFIEPIYNTFAALNWIFSIITIDLAITLIVFSINKNTGKPLFIEFILFATTSVLLYLSKNGIISFVFMNRYIENYILTGYYGFLIPVFLFFYIYRFSFLYFKNRLTLDSLNNKSKFSFDNLFNISKLSSKSFKGNLICLEFNMIFRNKRTRNVVLQIIVFLPLALIFLFQPTNNDWAVFYFFSILINAIAINYGSMMFGWESKYFELLNTLNISYKDYVKNKYYTLAIFMFLSYLLFLPFCIINSFDSVITASVLLYFSIGALIPIILYISMFNRKRVDLSASLMSQQGKGGFQYIIGLFVIIIPNGIFFSLKYFLNKEAGLIALSILGFLGVAFYNIIISGLSGRLRSSKYKMLQGFRERI